MKSKITESNKQKKSAKSKSAEKPDTPKSRKKNADAEISAETVVREEVFSSEQRANKRKKSCGCGCGGRTCGCPSDPKDEKISKAAKTTGDKKVKASVSKSGNRPTQKKAQMITTDDACDCGKS